MFRKFLGINYTFSVCSSLFYLRVNSFKRSLDLTLVTNYMAKRYLYIRSIFSIFIENCWGGRRGKVGPD